MEKSMEIKLSIIFLRLTLSIKLLHFHMTHMLLIGYIHILLVLQTKLERIITSSKGMSSALLKEI